MHPIWKVYSFNISKKNSSILGKAFNIFPNKVPMSAIPHFSIHQWTIHFLFYFLIYKIKKKKGKGEAKWNNNVCGYLNIYNFFLADELCKDDFKAHYGILGSFIWSLNYFRKWVPRYNERKIKRSICKLLALRLKIDYIYTL